MSSNLHISSTPLDIARCIEWVQSADCGGIDVFIGTVRNHTKGKAVVQLEFEAYETMALKEMQKIAQQAFDKWQLINLLIHHRTGVLTPGEVAVVIAVSAAHRAAAFEAC